MHQRKRNCSTCWNGGDEHAPVEMVRVPGVDFYAEQAKLGPFSVFNQINETKVTNTKEERHYE